jgi:hypothetical protein
MCTIESNILIMLPATYAASTYTFTGGNTAVLAMDHMEQEEVGRIQAMKMHQEESMNQRTKKRKVFSAVISAGMEEPFASTNDSDQKGLLEPLVGMDVLKLIPVDVRQPQRGGRRQQNDQKQHGENALPKLRHSPSTSPQWL